MPLKKEGRMSHTTKFTPPEGWARAALIHDGCDMLGTVELRAWYPRRSEPGDVAYMDPDIVLLLHPNGRIETKMSGSAPIPQQSKWLEQKLLYCAGVVVGAARLKAKITDAIERWDK
jgi:hypothetical protein